MKFWEMETPQRIEIDGKIFDWFPCREMFSVFNPGWTDSQGHERKPHWSNLSIKRMISYPEHERRKLAAVFQEISKRLLPAGEK